MPKIKVTQVYKTTRTIFLEVEGDPEVQQEKLASGEIDLPEWSDDRWVDEWDLQNEQFEQNDAEQKD